MAMMDMINAAEESLLHAYNRFPVVFDHGEGVSLYDTDGKRYLDAFSGIGVMALGYNDKRFTDALKAQIDKLTHICNLFYTEPLAEAARKFDAVSGMDRVFFANSGAEANEGALKVAKKYAYNKDGKNDHEVIAVDHSFHGRTFGALSVTGTEKYRAPFGPLPGPVHFVDFNDIEQIKANINDRTCAIMMEPIQGEGGIHPADAEYLKAVRALCDEHDILLIFDEVQCGMGRSGQMFAWQHFGVKPDVMTTAKALGNGYPVAAFAMTQRVADASMVAGDHGTTMGGNPLAAAAVNAVLDIYEEDKILEHVRELTPYMESALDALKEKHSRIIDRRGVGFMQAIELDGPVSDVIGAAREAGLIIISAGANTIRLLPPLVYTKEDIDEMCAILDKVL